VHRRATIIIIITTITTTIITTTTGDLRDARRWMAPLMGPFFFTV
jgi:hypothetical protein